MEEEVVQIQRPGRLLPLKPLNIPEAPPRRRLSQSWTENLEESSTSDLQTSPSVEQQRSPSFDAHNQRSPLQKVAAFFSDPISPIARVGKLQKQSSLDGGKPKKGERRESIRDHLLKFKQKAGRVLEEVHERLSEDHSSAVAPLVSSPTSRPGTDPLESDDPSGSERVISPTLSVASRKTTSSAELKASLRSKIRKQAEKVVERTRGSVQLTRRLQRRLTVHNEESFTEEEVKNVDEQIANSIKMGEKFMALQSPSSLPPDDEQFLFFTGIYEDQNVGTLNNEIAYLAAGPSKEDDPRMFILHEPDATDVENRGSLSITSLMKKRFPSAVWTDQLATNLVFEKKFKWDAPDEEPFVYLPALTAEVRQAEEELKMLLQMTVTVGSLAVVNHELCSVEEGIAASFRHSHSEQAALLERAAAFVQMIESSGNTKSSKQLMIELAKLQRDLESGAESLRQQWNALEASRAAQGFNLSTLKYNSKADKEDAYYIGTISEDTPIKETSSMPHEIQEKLKTKNNTSIKISLFFNDILVGRTPPRNLGNYNIHYGEVFNLQVKSIPQKLHAIITQKMNGKESEIARIEIKIPWTRNDEQSPIPFQEFNEKPVADRMRGFLVARVDWTPPESLEREKEAENTARNNEEPFSLIPPQCRLISDEEFEGNLRWDLLERRQQKKLPKSVESKPIGIDSSEIDPSLGINEERTQYSSGFRTAIDGHRALGAGYAVRIRTKLLERRNESERRITLEEVLKEVPLPSGIGGIGSLFGPADTSRKLKPMRLEDSRQQASAQLGTKLLINVQSATNLPERRGGGTLQPLVEVQFQGNTVKTGCAVGRHPNWQQCLSLPLDVEHMSDLKTVIDFLNIDIYDQLVVALPKDDREPNSVHEQLLHRYLGSVRVPFSTVYCRGRIDGGLRIQLPLFITGYTLPERASYIKVLIALDPPLSAPKISSLPDETSEPEKIMQQCTSWLKTNKDQFEDRRFTALVNDINGKSVLASRFLRPLKPPPSLDPIIPGRKGLEKVAKAVSFIPFLTDPLLFPGHVDLWTTIDHFVSYGCGDEEEHAILLCCWLLGSRITSYVVLGTALPEGEKSAYVLADLPDSTVLINPSDGSIYQTDDPMCPMTSVGCVVSPDNIYANIQARIHPSQLHFDFTKTNEWRPLFAKPDASVVPIQPKAISYQEVTEDGVVELRSSIERELKLRFDATRPFAIPQWNLMASRLLREMLNEDNWTQAIIDERFHRLRDSYNIFSSALKVPYRSLQKCAEEIMRLKMHTNTDPNVQFALGVHIQPYFNNIVGCSLALAVLIPKR